MLWILVSVTLKKLCFFWCSEYMNLILHLLIIASYLCFGNDWYDYFLPWSFYASTSSTYPPLISTQSWQRWSISWRSCLTSGQIDAQISTNSGQIRPKDPQEHKEIVASTLLFKIFQKGNDHLDSPGMRWDNFSSHTIMITLSCQWGFYPIVKTCKKCHDIVIFNGNVLGHAWIPECKKGTNRKDEMLFTYMPHANFQIIWH